jgi:hypothetical protein
MKLKLIHHTLINDIEGKKEKEKLGSLYTTTRNSPIEDSSDQSTSKFPMDSCSALGSIHALKTLRYEHLK